MRPQAPDDYPRSYEVWGSPDGSTWEKLTSGNGSNRLVHAEFWTAKWARYLKIVQTGSAASWWSLAEVAVYSGTTFDRAGWALSSSTSDDVAQAVDGRADLLMPRSMHS